MAQNWGAYKCVEEVSIATAESFIDILRPRNRYWGTGGTRYWYFRGQPDAKWALTPRAWRTSPPSGLERLAQTFEDYLQLLAAAPLMADLARAHHVLPVEIPEFQSFLAHVAAEADAVKHFAMLADELGLDISEFSDLISGKDFLQKVLENRLWPDIAVAAPFGIAQHHGIPTRLLDWTRKPLIAAYFASALSAGAHPEEIAVWAINIPFMASTDPSLGLKVMTSQRAQDPYLHRQEGLFIWHQDANAYFWKHRKWPSLIDSVEDAFTASNPHPLRVLKLPGSEVYNLCELLWHERISLAHLMPTYDNVARTAIATWAMDWGLRTEVSAY